MSTKIYTGMIATVHDPFEIKRRIDAVVRELYTEYMIALVEAARTLATTGVTWREAFSLPPGTVVSKMAAHEISGDGTWDTPIRDRKVWGYVDDLSDVIYEASAALKDQLQVNWSPLDFHYDVHIFPNARPGKKPLVLLFCERLGDKMREAILAEGIVREYGYWNNTDGPEGLSARKWRQREKAWDVLGYSAVSAYGLSFGTPSKFDATWPLYQHFQRQAELNPGQVLDHNLRLLFKSLEDGSLERKIQQAKSNAVFADLIAELDAL